MGRDDAELEGAVFLALRLARDGDREGAANGERRNIELTREHLRLASFERLLREIQARALS